MQIDWLVMKEIIAAAGVWGVSVQERERKNLAGKAWELLGRVIGLLLGAKNLAAQVHALAFAAGLDQLNGKRSQAEIARELGCTRALISHYVVGWADVLGLSVTKFRKSEASRETYKSVQLNRNH
jgi:predicted transcriptional regulator